MFRSRRNVLTLIAAGLAAPLRAADGGWLRRSWPRNQPTPALDLPGFDGPGFKLAEARGKLVLLNFWASWCEPCRSEMPALELLAQRYEREGLLVVAVNHRETDAAIRRFLQAMPVELPIVRDADGAASRAFGARMFPTSVLIARDGRALFSIIGELDWNAAEPRQWIEQALSTKSSNSQDKTI
ncbi:TlpA family protein disulfide reductase [Roseateles violae]|uniref:TlpA disulfide reductase family protein n=1 Tax=Roseateles violae TaxID=3058042 RepID=A0ABT8DU46_9BURK|nr:TlpA disulfide reductase family protein [Pelomonas sp. PFR6]MDN3919907.1 TlpA disulfide reductase family protein [Pelomonas sp. PFR6]